MVAIISDVHGNLEALEAVLRRISADGVDEIWCLGDIVGYGPNPRECVELVQRNCTICIMGNHDWAVVNTPLGFNAVATRMVYRTKGWMQVTEDSDERARGQWDFLSNLPLQSVQGEFLLVHASPRAALSEYVLPTDVEYDRSKLHDIFAMIDRYCLVGHTHVACCITADLELIIPEGNSFLVQLGEKKAIVNIGSVGQPRDGDNRASYVTLDQDGRSIIYRRVPYRFDRTMQKLHAVGEEYKVLADRLQTGC